MTDIIGLHHVGLLVHDMDAALTAFRRIGFNVAAPSYPALPPAPGAEPEPVGAGNTHADFPRNFIELAAIVPEGGRLPQGAKVVTLEAPDEKLAGFHAAMRSTVAGLTSRLDRFEGAHILMLATDDADATAARLGEEGAVHASHRPLHTVDGPTMAPMRFMEFTGDDPAVPGMHPEGRIGAVEETDHDLLDSQTGLEHPNGAISLVECIVGVEDLDRTAKRYEHHLGIAPSRSANERVFELASGRLTLTEPDGFTKRFPGEKLDTVPRLAAYTVKVADLAATQSFLEGQDVHFGRTNGADPFVPAAEALGATIAFRE